MIAPPVLFLALVLAAGSLLWRQGDEQRGGPVGHMHDVAGELSSNIESMASRGLAKTQALAQDPRLAGVIAAGDRKGAEAFANELLRGSLELDIVAIFDAQGLLLAVNTLDHEGKPVPASGLNDIYGADFSQRGVVQGCLRETSDASRIEFQTKCDFTPAFFGSSGLSVAFSAPVADKAVGSRAGVVSTRLNFKRMTELMRENAFVRAGNSVYMVTDSGGFFDEDINSGRTPAPLSTDQVGATLRSDTSGSAGDIVVRRDGMVLMGRRVTATSAVDGGGINVLLRASEDWVEGERLRTRRLAAGALMGSLLAAGVWFLYLAARTKQVRAQSALSAERVRTALILENVGESIVSADRSGRIEFANPAAYAALAAAEGSLAGRQVAELFGDGVLAPLDQAWRAEQTTMRRGNGTTFQGRVLCTVLPGGSGGGCVLAFSDLTEKLETDRKLLDATRQAGMAEVATGVLHNVGNVLNSVNVAACVVASKLKHSEIPNLERAGGMIEEHRADLPQYLQSDERGRHLPEFLIEVARTLGAEQRSMLGELEAVTKGIEHVKHVVSLQQQHAKRASVVEPVKPADVMETAIQLQLDSLNRHGVTVDRRFGTIAPALIDKHLVLQILINLIANARHAMQDLEPGRRRLTVVTRTEGDGDDRRLLLEVTDNGIGIPAENLRRIFAQGFTTKEDGHGFGLHSAANAATQMGGSLNAASDGPGKGSTFVLTLPLSTKASRPTAIAR